MPSHIHNLWEELDLLEEYPELDPEAVLARVNAALGSEECPRKPTMKRKLRLGLILAAALVLLTGTALAVAQSAGLLELFFQGDTSQLEPYVLTVIDSAENEDYRLSVNSALYDGQNIYAIITVEGLNDQAVKDLKSNRVIAESHRESWGDSMVESLLESGSLGPDTFCYNFTQFLSGCGSNELPAPSETSRSWKVSISFQYFIGVQEEPFEFWLNFMGREYAVHFPLDAIVEPIRITPNEEVTANTLLGLKGILKEFTLTPTSFRFDLECVGDWTAYSHTSGAVEDVTNLFFLRMKDGTVLTSSQLGVINQQMQTVVDLEQVQSIIFGYTEFPVDGSPSKPAGLDPKLYPFPLTYPAYQDLDHLYENKVSLQLLCQDLGADYQWDEERQTATAVYRGVTVEATLGSTTVYVDGSPVEIPERQVPYEQGQNSDPVYVSNPVSESDFEADLLVNISPLEEAWNIQFYWNRINNYEEKNDQGEAIFTSYGMIVTP